jgi:rubrerythrin
MKKSVFKDSFGNIHFGVNAPGEFQKGEREDVDRVVENLGEKKLWRCNVCNDLHISKEPLRECPTCYAKNAYIEIELDEFKKILEIL